MPLSGRWEHNIHHYLKERIIITHHYLKHKRDIYLYTRNNINPINTEYWNRVQLIFLNHMVEDARPDYYLI